ncbi:MAG: hypothetical protein KBS76_05255 [Ruminococcus sp.]|nr:hypothetical protein [Candidatus Apopatosoma intestinale]
MKRLVSILLLFALLCALVSCGPGASVPFFTLQTRASFEQVWTDPTILSFSEDITYPGRDDDSYHYWIYYERADKSGNYNICEKIPGVLDSKDFSSALPVKDRAVSFYAHEGDLYVVSGKAVGKEVYAILPLFDLYSDFVRSYQTLTHPLDAGQHYQLRAKVSADGSKTVWYRSQITLAMEANLAGYGAVAGQYIFSRYMLDEVGRYQKIFYSVGETESEATLVCYREFSYSSERDVEIFAELPDLSDPVTVTLRFPSGNGESYRIPSGARIGIDLPKAGRTIECYRNAGMTEPFDMNNTPITDDITLYVKATDNK